MLSNRVLWCLVTLFRVLRGKLRATANEIMRGRSERVTTEAIWTRDIEPTSSFGLAMTTDGKWYEERKRKERELAAWCVWAQLISFPSLLFTTATIRDAICYSKLLREDQTAQLWINNGYTAAAQHPILERTRLREEQLVFLP